MLRGHFNGKAGLGRPGSLAAALLFAALFFFPTDAGARAPVDSVDVTIPHKSGVGIQQIHVVKITLSITAGNMNPVPSLPVNITLTRGTDTGTGTITAYGGDSGITPIGLGSSGQAMVVFAPPTTNPITMAALADNDPLKRKYDVWLFLDANVVTGSCASKSPTDMSETWTVTATRGPSGSTTPLKFDGACAQSLDKNAGDGACGTNYRSVPPNDNGTAANSIAMISGPAASLGCRPGLDCILVLDRSGSMSEPGRVSGTKMDSLKNAVRIFTESWKALVANEATHNINSPTDRIGVVLFDDAIPAQWLRDVDAASTTTPRAGLSNPPPDTFTAALADNIKNSFRVSGSPVTPRNGTSIGGGLRLGDGSLNALGADASRRKVFIVMTDGMENSDPQTKVTMGTPRVQTTVGGVGTNLLTQPPAQINTITIGASNTVNPDFMQSIATASNGLYLNNEFNDAALANFFVEVLQNFIRYSTVETYLLVSDETKFSNPFSRPFPVTSTTTSLTFGLTWSGPGELKITAIPPSGGPGFVQQVTTSNSHGSLVLNVPLMVKGAPAAGGNWTVRVERDNVIGMLPQQQETAVPFNLIVLGDDSAVNSVLAPVSADYAPGDQIRLSVRVNELGKPLVGLNSQPGAAVVADLVRPDEGGIGDLLSASTAPTTQPASPDQRNAADAKLLNILNSDPDAIKTATTAVTLLDNGNAANGDAAANDGVYSALFPAQLIGHYNFVFGVTGKTKQSGSFTRQQIRTVHVRAVPDGGQTTTTASVQGNAVVVQMTPLTKFGHHIGPGYHSHFWVTASGLTPVMFKDNFDGTYTANLPFSGSPPSDVQVHFERVNERIPDNATPGQLPIPLGNGTVFEPNVPVTGGPTGAPFKHWGFSLHGGVSIPHGNFNNTYNPGPNFGVDLEYRFNKYFSAEAIYTFHRFNSEFAFFDDLNVHQFSLNGKLYATTAPVRPFFNFGGGAYKFAPGSTRGGVNVGGGIQFDVTPTFAIDGMYNHHTVFFPLSDLKFSSVQAGVRWRF